MQNTEKMDKARVRLAAIREINSIIRLYLQECRALDVTPAASKLKNLKDQRDKLLHLVFNYLGAE